MLIDSQIFSSFFNEARLIKQFLKCVSSKLTHVIIKVYELLG